MRQEPSLARFCYEVIMRAVRGTGSGAFFWMRCVMKQKDVMRAMGWAGAAAGAAAAVGYFLQSGSGSKRWKSLSRSVRGMVDSAGSELTRLGRDMGILGSSSRSSRSRSLTGRSDSAEASGSSDSQGKSKRRSSLKKSAPSRRSKKSA
jgi:hypothetical protein